MRDVLTTVLPDRDNTGGEHPWEWLAELARARKIDVTADGHALMALSQAPRYSLTAPA